jgi:diaminopimelate epimerase
MALLKPTLISKYSGAGNDFVLIDDREEFFPVEDRSSIKALCHRQNGVGADGVILLQPSSVADVRFRIFNADGSEAEMCGNGMRCFGRFLFSLNQDKRVYSVETKERLLSLFIEEEEVSVDLGAFQELKLHQELHLDDRVIPYHFVNTGVPHLVLFKDYMKEAPKIAHHPDFPVGTNVDYISSFKENEIVLRTFERGVEQETLACGTGAAAAALIYSLIYKEAMPIRVRVASGEFLTVTLQANRLHLSGTAKQIFQGTYYPHV